jgi:hypothetical protein
VLIQRDSKAWQVQVWVSFADCRRSCVAVGLAYLPGKDLDRAFMVMGYFFCLSAAFVLAKYRAGPAKKGASMARTDPADTPMFKARCLGRLLPGDVPDRLGVDGGWRSTKPTRPSSA